MDSNTPIAIIGIGCRLSGGADSGEKLWKILANGEDTWSKIPSNRWNETSFLSKDQEQPGMQNVRGGHFLDQDLAAFDGGFFDMTPAECEAVDPQIRMQLEVTYEALENAGLRIEDVKGSNTAVYMAVFSENYKEMHLKDMIDIPKYHIVGVSSAMSANRLSYQLDLKGPSFTVDTGCSGGMVAIHQACQSLRTGESYMALAGGANLILSPDQMTTMSLANIFSDDGRCYFLDTRGTGYGRGEGAAILALKRLDDAIRDNDPIRAVIRASGLNQDGKTNGIIAPSTEAQQALIDRLYRDANLDPKETPVVEAHGTGTAVGDPKEVAAIRQALGRSPSEAPLYMGSLKPNIGHLESASGITAVIKGVLMLEHSQIPPIINIAELKPNLRLDEYGIRISKKLSDWPEGQKKRVSLNNFGYGGTNGHVILDGVEEFVPSKLITAGNDEADVNSPQILALSARSAESLTKLVSELRDWASTHEGSGNTFEDLSYTLTSRRSILPYRTTFTAASISSLTNLASKTPTKSSANVQPVFVFTGQGAQWYAMGRDLLSISSPFSASIQKSDDILRDLGASWSLVGELEKNEKDSRINESELSQPGTTAIQIALVDLLSSVGVTPRTVVGHSSGEIGAAYAAGALSQSSALRAAYFRGRLNRAPEARKGAMLAVGLAETDAEKYLIHAKSGKAVIACANSPSSTTVSGDEDAIGDVEAALKSDGKFARRLLVDRAYHSHHMQEVAAQYLSNLEGLEHGSTNGSVTFVSSVYGKVQTKGFGPQYWVDNLVSKVRFAEALSIALDVSSMKSHQPIVEIGPHAALAGPVRQTLPTLSKSLKTSQHSALLRGKSAMETFAILAGELFELGYTADLAGVNSILRPHRSQNVLTSLPAYPWNHSNTYWYESRLSKEHRFRKHPHHDLLGTRQPSDGSPSSTWRHIPDVTRLPWLREHSINGEIIFPAAGYVAMAIEATRQLMQDRGIIDKVSSYQLRDVAFTAPLVIPDGGRAMEMQLKIIPVDGATWDDFKIYSIDTEGNSTENCHGSIIAVLEGADEVEGSREFSFNQESLIEGLETARSSVVDAIDTEGFYSGLKSRGNVYGEHFACCKELTVGDGHALSKLHIPDVADCMPSGTQQPHLIHPAVIDAFLHPTIAIYDRASGGNSMVTAAIGNLNISSSILSKPGTVLEYHTTLTDQWNQTCTSTINAFQTGPNGEIQPVVQLQGLRLQGLGMSEDTSAADQREINYHLEWRPDVDFISPKDVNPTLDEVDSVSLVQAHKMKTLNQASALYIDQCLKQVAATRNINIRRNYKRLQQWMERFHASQEYSDLLSNVSESDASEILALSRTMGVEGEVVTRIGSNLFQVITGDVDPIGLITEKDLLYRLYADDASVRCYDFAIEYLRHLIFKDPNLAVLEIGAGTGGTTEPILEALSLGDELPFKSYDFTDVSTGFFERSKQRLQRWESKMTFRKYDVQEDAKPQGLEEGSYDLVLGTNVLHVAHDTDEALTNLRNLLKPGGRILLIEATRIIPFLNVTVGVLPGWWAATDGRTDGPLLSETQWDAAFARNGLGGTSLVAQDFTGPAHRASMLVSQPLGSQEVAPSQTPAEVLLGPGFVDSRPALLDALTATLGAQGRPISVSSFANAELSSDKTYIVLDNGDKPALGLNDPELFKKITGFVSASISALWISVQETSDKVDSPEHALIRGFTRVARIENKSLRLVTLDVQAGIDTTELSETLATVATKIVQSFQSESPQPVVEQDLIFKDGKVQVPRVLPDSSINQSVSKFLGKREAELQPFHQANRPLRLALGKTRNLDKLEFEEDDSLQSALAPTDVEIDVQVHGVNFKDMLIAGGHVKKKLDMAGEFSGTIAAVGADFKGQFAIGDRVCGFGASPYASRVRVRGAAVGRLPPEVSFDIGASIPVIFATAYHGLIDIARLEKGQSVLIHSAAGGVGQAAVAIAQWVGAEIFATVGSTAKKEYLVHQFGIPEDHIFSSKLRTFKDGILRLTKGQGVDVVLNSLSGQILQDSMSIVAKFGTFVELGKTDAHAGTRVSFAPFDLSITVAAIDLSMVNKYRPAKAGQLFAKVLSLIARKELRTPGLTVLPIEEIGSAFRMMQARSHIGKIVLNAGSTAKVRAPPRKKATVFAADGTYVIAGGRGGIGFEIGKYLAANGAGHIVLLSRREVTAAEEAETQDAFSSTGANVKLLSCDITQWSQVQDRLLSSLSSLPPVRGVFQSTMVPREIHIPEIELSDFAFTIAPKVLGTQNLIRAFEPQPPEFFLSMSSVVGGLIGTIALASYAAANAYLSALVTTRTNNATRFLAICPGAIEDVGVVKDNENARKILEMQGYITMKVEEVIGLVDYALGEEATSRGTNELAAGFNYKSLERGGALGALFTHLPREQAGSSGSGAENAAESIETTIANAATKEDAEAVVTSAILSKVSTLLARAEDDIDPDRSVADMGMDSLVVVELKTWIGRTLQAKVTSADIQDAPSIPQLAKVIGAKSQLVASKPAAPLAGVQA
ncbi:hypothetical protein N0V90_010082 [Kalmusia sp. IMI 367209]|nr:hypothetical protein N0V90_010082 [Kalmusia sp. IMI 367209]